MTDVHVGQATTPDRRQPWHRRGSTSGSWTAVVLLCCGVTIIGVAVIAQSWWAAGVGGALLITGAVVAWRARIMQVATVTQNASQGR